MYPATKRNSNDDSPDDHEGWCEKGFGQAKHAAANRFAVATKEPEIVAPATSLPEKEEEEASSKNELADAQQDLDDTQKLMKVDALLFDNVDEQTHEVGKQVQKHVVMEQPVMD